MERNIEVHNRGSKKTEEKNENDTAFRWFGDEWWRKNIKIFKKDVFENDDESRKEIESEEWNLVREQLFKIKTLSGTVTLKFMNSSGTNYVKKKKRTKIYKRTFRFFFSYFLSLPLFLSFSISIDLKKKKKNEEDGEEEKYIESYFIFFFFFCWNTCWNDQILFLYRKKIYKKFYKMVWVWSEQMKDKSHNKTLQNTSRALLFWLF